MADPLIPTAPPPMPGVVTKDAPSPLEAFWRARWPGQHPIPYEHLTVRKSLQLFDAMMTDETIAYAHRLKVTSRLASGWSLRPPEDDDGDPLPGAEIVCDHVQAQLEQWSRFDEFLEQMLDAMRQGFKVGEIVTRDGKVDGRRGWLVADVKVRNSRFFAFDVDPSGELFGDGILEYIDQNPDGGGFQPYWSPGSVARHSPDKFVRWSYCPRDSNAYSLYGYSDFLPVYRGYFLKDVGLKGWGETLDTYKHPTIVAMLRTGLTEVQRQDFIAKVADGLKRKVIAIPAECLPESIPVKDSVQIHEVTGKAKEFGEQCEYLDKTIMRGLLVGQLVAETGGDGKGSYALGKQHVSIFLRIMSSVGRSLGRAISDTLFSKMVRWNLGEEAVALTPTLQWHAVGDSETLERAQIVQALVTAGVVDPAEKWLREYLGEFPKMDPEIEARRDEERQKRLEAETAPPSPSGGPPKGKAAGLGATEAVGAETEEEPIDLGPIEPEERKVSPESIEAADARIRAKYEALLFDEWSKVFDGAGGVKAQFRVATASDRGLSSIRVDGAGVADVMRRLTVEQIVEGAVEAWMEVNRGLLLQEEGQLDSIDQVEAEDGGEVVEIDELASVTIHRPAPRAPKPLVTIDLEQFAKERGVDLDAQLAQLARRVRLSKSELSRYAELRIQTVRNEVQAQVERLREEARAAIRRARSAKGRAARRDEMRQLEKKWVGIERALGDEQSALMSTISNAAYNEGRMRLYRGAPKGLVVGLMYSAILDRRTTPFCRSWNRYRALLDDPVWRSVTPPNHWHCRSILVAVLRGERTKRQLELDSRKRPDAAPAKGFRRSKFSPSVPHVPRR